MGERGKGTTMEEVERLANWKNGAKWGYRIAGLIVRVLVL